MAYQSHMRQDHAASIQQILAERADEGQELDGAMLTDYTGLRSNEINEAVALMVQNGHVTCDYSEGRRPYAFTTVRLTQEGRAHYHQRRRS